MLAPVATTAKGQQTRQQLVRAAMKSFAERGFSATSLDAVAAVAGVTRQGLLHYFPTKTHLLLAVLDQRDEEDRRFARGVDRQAGYEVGAGLLALLKRNQRDPEFARLFAMAAGESVNPEHPGHDYFRKRFQRVRDLMRAGIVQEQASGRITREIEADTLAVTLIALINGLNLHQLLDPDLDASTALAAFLQAISTHNARLPDPADSDTTTVG